MYLLFVLSYEGSLLYITESKYIDDFYYNSLNNYFTSVDTLCFSVKSVTIAEISQKPKLNNSPFYLNFYHLGRCLRVYLSYQI